MDYLTFLVLLVVVSCHAMTLAQAQSFCSTNAQCACNGACSATTRDAWCYVSSNCNEATYDYVYRDYWAYCSKCKATPSPSIPCKTWCHDENTCAEECPNSLSYRSCSTCSSSPTSQAPTPALPISSPISSPVAPTVPPSFRAKCEEECSAKGLCLTQCSQFGGISVTNCASCNTPPPTFTGFLQRQSHVIVDNCGQPSGFSIVSCCSEAYNVVETDSRIDLVPLVDTCDGLNCFYFQGEKGGAQGSEIELVDRQSGLTFIAQANGDKVTFKLKDSPCSMTFKITSGSVLGSQSSSGGSISQLSIIVAMAITLALVHF